MKSRAEYSSLVLTTLLLILTVTCAAAADQLCLPQPAPDQHSFISLCNVRNFSEYVTTKASTAQHLVMQKVLDVVTMSNYTGRGPGCLMSTSIISEMSIDAFVYVSYDGTSSDWYKCIRKAADLAESSCPDAVGAQIAMPDCCFRYETYMFCELDVV
ncbi:hypothetical protein LINPERPRIM_LOCUS8602 [Linum perenne]